MQTSAVYACVRILAESVAGLPLHVYGWSDDGGKIAMLGHSLCRLLQAPGSQVAGEKSVPPQFLWVPRFSPDIIS